MLESGSGRAHNIGLSTLPDCTLRPYRQQRHWTKDVIDPEVTVTPQETIRVTRGPGIGYEPSGDRTEQLTVCREVLR
jgi:O-succinylbenzoate synthase